MAGDGGRLTRVIAAIASGDGVDWESVGPAADNSEERRLLDQLRIIQYVAAVHRQDAPAAGTFEISTARALPTQWGHLQIRSVLGRGASAVVCSAWDPALSRDVANTNGPAASLALTASARRFISTLKKFRRISHAVGAATASGSFPSISATSWARNVSPLVPGLLAVCDVMSE